MTTPHTPDAAQSRIRIYEDAKKQSAYEDGQRAHANDHYQWRPNAIRASQLYGYASDAFLAGWRDADMPAEPFRLEFGFDGNIRVKS